MSVAANIAKGKEGLALVDGSSYTCRCLTRLLVAIAADRSPLKNNSWSMLKTVVLILALAVLANLCHVTVQHIRVPRLLLPATS
jgi:hypothetical protein